MNYPSYGRGLPQPTRDLQTYMVNPKLCADPSENKRQASGSGSPKPSQAAQQRKRIVSPKRLKFEKLFESYVHKKHVNERLVEQPPPEMDFDTTTKPTGTLNTKVNKKLKWIKDEKKK